jgi:hypothetical protein
MDETVPLRMGQENHAAAAEILMLDFWADRKSENRVFFFT